MRKHRNLVFSMLFASLISPTCLYGWGAVCYIIRETEKRQNINVLLLTPRPLFLGRINFLTKRGNKMKKTLTFLSALALAACNSGGGGGGTVNMVPVSSVVESYNQTDYSNFKEYFDNVIADSGTYTDFVETDVNWPSQDGHKRYTYNEHFYGEQTEHHVVNEKEMQLVNYGTHSSCNIVSGNCFYASTNPPSGYIHNREGIGANLYTPLSGTTFTGGALAYLVNPNNNVGGVNYLRGDATYTYNPIHPELTLDFDNYYTFNIVQGDGDSSTVTVSGTNDSYTGFNMTTGTYEVDGTNANFTTEHLQNGYVQEAAGTYEMHFGDDYIDSGTAGDFAIYGAFGGSH